MNKKTIILVATALLLTFGLHAKTLHLIMFSNTIDHKIGHTCLVDHDRVYQEVSTIADYLDYEIKYYDYYGQECSNDNLMGLLADLQCASDDIVFFYYTGHGVHAAADPGSFPQMCLKYDSYQQDKFVPVRIVEEKLAKKNAQLRIIITDCCNNIADWVSAKGYFEGYAKASTISEVQAKYYRQLFSQQKGSVIITSSKKGQTSGCNVRVGGFFTHSLFAVFDQVGLGKIAPDWKQVAERVTSSTLQMTGQQQEPFGSINVSRIGTPPAPTFVVNGGSDEYETTTRVQKLFKSLTDRRTMLADRFAIADNAKAILFARDAKIRIVGRDQKTTVGLEDVATYLSRICQDKKLVSVSVLTEMTDKTDKYTYLVVHEVYSE